MDVPLLLTRVPFAATKRIVGSGGDIGGRDDAVVVVAAPVFLDAFEQLRQIVRFGGSLEAILELDLMIIIMVVVVVVVGLWLRRLLWKE